jgi:hypothetical protein
LKATALRIIAPVLGADRKRKSQKETMIMEKEKIESKEEKHYRPYRRDPDDPSHLIFPSRPYVIHRDMGPLPEMPEVKELLKFDDLRLEKVSHETGRSIPRVRKNKDGVRFIFMTINLEMKNGSKICGLMPEADYQKFKAARMAYAWPLRLPKDVESPKEGASKADK